MNTIEKYKKYVNTSMVDKIQPVVIEKAHGALITDINGKEYIDCFFWDSSCECGSLQ